MACARSADGDGRDRQPDAHLRHSGQDRQRRAPAGHGGHPAHQLAQGILHERGARRLGRPARTAQGLEASAFFGGARLFDAIARAIAQTTRFEHRRGFDQVQRTLRGGIAFGIAQPSSALSAPGRLRTSAIAESVRPLSRNSRARSSRRCGLRRWRAFAADHEQLRQFFAEAGETVLFARPSPAAAKALRAARSAGRA